jgi:hypothetical protein
MELNLRHRVASRQSVSGAPPAGICDVNLGSSSILGTRSSDTYTYVSRGRAARAAAPARAAARACGTHRTTVIASVTALLPPRGRRLLPGRWAAGAFHAASAACSQQRSLQLLRFSLAVR